MGKNALAQNLTYSAQCDLFFYVVGSIKLFTGLVIVILMRRMVIIVMVSEYEGYSL